MSRGKGVIPAQTNRLFLAGPHSGQTTTHSHSHLLIAFGLLIVFGLIMKDFRSLTIQSLDCGRKPKHLDGTHKDKCGKHTTFIEKGPSHQESQLATFPPIHWPLMTTSQACQLTDPSRTPELHQCSYGTTTAIQFTTHQLHKLLIIFIDILIFSQYL